MAKSVRQLLSCTGVGKTGDFIAHTILPLSQQQSIPSNKMLLQQITLLTLPLLVSGASHLRRTKVETFQPIVITVEGSPPRKVWGSISMPNGSPWCDGNPTYWLVGHESKEAPWCLVSNGTTWAQPENTDMMEGPFDRHNCATLDVNQDGVPDILCGLGAVSGTELGYNEVYITNATDGSLVKAAQGHGLDKYPTMRNRFMKTLKSVDGADLVFLASKGIVREDGLPNNHRMFRLVHPTPETFHFEEVGGPRPWARYTDASCLQIVDANQDGLDDVLLCNHKARGMLFVQQTDGSWEMEHFETRLARDWRNARVADIDGDGINDLVIVGFGGRKISQPNSFLRVFRGIGEAPYFDVSAEGFLYGRSLPHASPDLEILDVNSDGSPDIYVVQVDQWTRGTYCSSPFVKSDWWERGYNQFVPPLDAAADLLLVRTPSQRRMFLPVDMNHTMPGCGSFVEKFGDDRTLVLAQGARDRPGNNLLLKW